MIRSFRVPYRVCKENVDVSEAFEEIHRILQKMRMEFMTFATSWPAS